MRQAEARAYLNRISDQLEKAGLDVHSELLSGDPATRIVEFVQTKDVDLILLSSHGLSGLTGWNISSVVQKTVIRVNKPTMIIRSYQPSPNGLYETKYQKIFVPLDGSQRAECVLPMASSLAESHGSTLMLAHVIRKPELPRRAPLSQEELELADRLTERNRQEAHHYLQELQTRLPGVVETRLSQGRDVADTVHELIQEEKPDLVVMSAHGYSGSTHWPYGSLSLHFIAYGRTPLLIVQDLPENQVAFPTDSKGTTGEQGS
jgi:nucleotide-binding universal stress UspA family protein